MERERLRGLDALRGFAALVVLWFHLRAQFDVGFYPRRGYLAVDFFFMMSGYVMARTYEPGMLGGGRFLVKRVRRLAPTITLGSLIGFFVLWWTGFPGLAAVTLLNLLLLPALWAGPAFPLDTPAWSIFFELFANALHGFWLHRVRTTYLAGLVIAAGALTLVLALGVGSYSQGSEAGRFVGGFPRVVFAYFYGVVLWRLWQDRPPVRPHPVLLILVAAFLFAPRSVVADFMFVAAVCPLLIAGGLAANPDVWASIVGRLSFPLYAVHRPILALAALLGVGWFLGAVSALLLSAAMTLAFPRRPGFGKKGYPKSEAAERGKGGSVAAQAVPDA